MATTTTTTSTLILNFATPFVCVPKTKPINISMNPSLSLPSKLRPNPFLLALSRLRPFYASPGTSAAAAAVRVRVRAAAKASTLQSHHLKENWLASLSSPPPPPIQSLAGDGDVEVLAAGNAGPGWVIGVDPDTYGAVAVLNGHGSDCSAQVFDSPHLPVIVGGRVRKRLDAKSITELLRSLDVPVGTTAYIEQSIPFPKDGKQGWWCGGFGYGLWIGILVALGYSVVPVPSVSWKRKFELSGSSFTKDDSRRVASTLFPSMSLLLKRKKDHGRAEALLIAAYGQGIKMKVDSSIAFDELIS